MKKSESLEMYLETILLLSKDKGNTSVVEIAKKLSVSKPSVNKAMNLLKNEGLVSQEPYSPIMLTELGKTEAENIYKKHKLVREFLLNTLQISVESAEENACRIEHYLSDDVFEAMKNYNEK